MHNVFAEFETTDGQIVFVNINRIEMVSEGYSSDDASHIHFRGGKKDHHITVKGAPEEVIQKIIDTDRGLTS